MIDTTAYGRRGVVASIDGRASSAGIALLRAGGSAADAAVAASAVLAVTAQHLCGMGGDLVAVVHPGGTDAPQALLGVGRAGSGADPAALRAEGHQRLPFRGDVRSATVPGCVDGWLALHARYGRRPLSEVLAPAVELAAEGFALTPLLAAALSRVAEVAGAQELLGVDGPRAGALRTRPGIAVALRAIGTEGRGAWYGGPFGAGLLALGRGWFAAEDLETDLGEWCEPLTVDLPAGERLHVPPAPTQGYLSALSAAIAARLPVPADPDDPQWPHLLIEASRAAGHDRPSQLHDRADLAPLLAPDQVARRAATVDPRRAGSVGVDAGPGGTQFLLAVDAEGSAVALSQSNASGFGAHVVVPDVGVWLHNRGIGFSLDPGAPNLLAPGRRPVHTLTPTLSTGNDGELRRVVGTMGGDAQPQVVLQLLARLQAGAAPGSAVTAPRWSLAGAGGTGFDTWEPADLPPSVRVEEDAPQAWFEGLAALGHPVERAEAGGGFGHAHVAELDGAVAEAGVVAAAGADPRSGSGAALAL